MSGKMMRWSPSISNLSVKAPFDFDQRASHQRARAEFRVMAVQQVLPDDRDLDVLNRFPSEPHVQRNVVRNARRETGKVVNVSADQVELEVVGQVERRAH